MRFSQWLHTVEAMSTAPSAQTATTKKFKTQLQARLKGIAAGAASGKPTQDPSKVVNDLAAQMMTQGDAGAGDAAELAGAMQRTKDVARPNATGRMA